MRKAGIMIMSIIVTTVLAGCQKTPDVNRNKQEEPAVGMENPWNNDATAQEAEELTGAKLIVPDGAYDVAYLTLDSEKLAEMNFTLGDARFSVSVKPASDFEDISGLYYEWDAEGVDKVGDADAQIRLFFDENISNVLWYDGERMYSVFTNGADKEGMEALRVANIVYGATETSENADYDMYGYVVDKLPEDEYYNHYNVKGDNDDIYICNYNGNDELAEGPSVGMWQIGDGWTIEVLENTANEADNGIIYKDENGVGIIDMRVSLEGSTYNFSVTLRNSTEKDQQFDPKKLKLENYDGTEITVFAEDESVIDLTAKTDHRQQTYQIQDSGNLQAGDEVSVYYEDAFIYSTIVTE